MSLSEQLSFWEQVYKYAKHSVRKKKAKEMVEFLKEMKEEIESFQRFYNNNAINNLTKSTLK